jgi:hypothetical protein
MIRFMMLAMAVSGFSLGSLARADEAEDKAAAFVEKHHGSITRDTKAPGKPVVKVRWGGSGVTDAWLKERSRPVPLLMA